jgi:hypothetical protein
VFNLKLDRHCYNQGCGSGFELDPDLIGSVDPDPESESGSGIGIQEGKNYQQKKKKINKFHVLCWMFSFESFFCNLDVLYGGLGIDKL